MHLWFSDFHPIGQHCEPIKQCPPNTTLFRSQLHFNLTRAQCIRLWWLPVKELTKESLLRTPIAYAGHRVQEELCAAVCGVPAQWQDGQ